MSVKIFEDKTSIDIVPDGEEDLHTLGVGCRCWPVVTLPHPDAKHVFTHNSLKHKSAEIEEFEEFRRAA